MELTRRGLLAGAASAALLLTPAGAAVASPGHQQARGRLRDLEQSFDGRIGAFALDTGTGDRVAYRADELFPLLSTFKAMAGAAILRTARRCEPGLLDRLVTWTEADLVPFSPVTELHVDTGLTVAELCHAAITRSDNTAGNLLLELLGGPPGLTAFARSLGDRVTRLDRWEVELNDWTPGERRDTTTPAAIGKDLYALTVGNALASEDREQLNDWLRANTTGDARIRAGLPADWTVGDKTGTGQAYGLANDIAIAWPPSAPPLIIAIYTNRHQPDATVDNTVIATTATILVEALGRIAAW